MANFQVYGRFSGRFDNTVVQGGSVERPVSFTVGGVKFERVVSIANAANTTVYSNTLAGDFDFLYIASDYNVRLKLTDSNSNTFSLWLKGTGTTNRYGVPLMLGLDETTDALNTITTLQVFNTSGNTAKVRVFLAT